VVVQVRQVDADKSVQLVEHQLQHRKLGVEQVTHGITFDYLAHDCESKGLFLVHDEVQEASDEVHALAVVQIRVHNCVCLQYFLQGVVRNFLQIVETANDVHFYCL